jgi:hypothetical protein
MVYSALTGTLLHISSLDFWKSQLEVDLHTLYLRSGIFSKPFRTVDADLCSPTCVTTVAMAVYTTPSKENTMMLDRMMKKKYRAVTALSRRERVGAP